MGAIAIRSFPTFDLTISQLVAGFLKMWHEIMNGQPLTYEVQQFENVVKDPMQRELQLRIPIASVQVG